MKKYLALLIAMLALSFMVSGAVAAKDNNAAHKVPLKIVKVNKEFKIALESNPTTGYSWTPKFNSKYIKLVNSTYVAYKTDPGMVGSGGIQIFTFKAIKPGKTAITMQYQRPWENSPIKEVKYNIIILKHFIFRR
jgi:inhibitor of cysteine peptidase